MAFFSWECFFLGLPGSSFSLVPFPGPLPPLSPSKLCTTLSQESGTMGYPQGLQFNHLERGPGVGGLCYRGPHCDSDPGWGWPLSVLGCPTLSSPPIPLTLRETEFSLAAYNFFYKTERLNWEEGHGANDREERERGVMVTVSITAGHLGLNPAGSPKEHVEQSSKALQAFSICFTSNGVKVPWVMNSLM